MLTVLRDLVGMAVDYNGTMARKVAELTGLEIARGSEEGQALQSFLAPFLPLAEKLDLAALEALHGRMCESGIRLADGLTGASLVEALIRRPIAQLAGDPVRAAELLPRYEDFWNARGRTPFAAAAYGGALFQVSFASRGGGGLTEVPVERWRLAERLQTKARGIMAAAEEAAEHCAFWHRTSFALSLADEVSDHERARRFRAALKFDTHDIALYLERACQLLPRYGGEAEEIETFARASVARTRDRFGMMMYARIHAAITEAEGRPLDTIDRHLMKDSALDWLHHCPSQMVANRAAQAAFRAEDLATVRQLFEETIRVYHPAAWAHPREAWHAWTQAMSMKPKSRSAPDRRVA